jgi:cGMP-dependent protein kinase
MRKDIVKQVANVVFVKKFRRGEFIIHEGDIGKEMYVILKGEVIIQIGEELVTKVGPKQTFGEKALETKEPRYADAIAESEFVVVLVLTNDAYSATVLSHKLKEMRLIKKQLQQNQIFANWTKSKIDQLSTLSVLKEYAPGEMIYDFGSKAVHLFVVRTGSVDLMTKLTLKK